MVGIYYNDEGEKVFAIELYQESFDAEKLGLRDILNALEDGESVSVEALNERQTLFYMSNGCLIFADQSEEWDGVRDEQELTEEKMRTFEHDFSEWLTTEQLTGRRTRVIFVYEPL